MAYTLEYDGVVKTLAEWGLSGCTLSEKGWAPSSFQFVHVGAAFDAAPIFPKDAVIKLRLDGSLKFVGFITQIPAHASGDDESCMYVAENLLGDMDRRVYGQTWRSLSGGSLTTGASAAAVLFADGGGSQSVALTLAAVVNRAAAAGVSVQMGTAANLTISPRKIDVRCMTYLEVLRAACVYSPDVIPQVDYATDPPTLHFIRRADATAHDLPVTDAADDFAIEPLYDQQCSGVYLVYERTGNLDGLNYLSLSNDIYPPGTASDARRVLFAVQQLQGASLPYSQVTTQTIETANIDEEDIEWWKTRVPYLADANDEATITDVTVTDENGDDATAHKELRSGVIYEWMGGTTQVVTIKGIFNGMIAGSPVLNQVITIRLVNTTLASGDYSTTAGATPAPSAPPEFPPVGVAQHLYEALNPLQWRGTRTLIERECSANIRAGDVANFTGTTREDWAAARAQVQQVVSKLDIGETVITFGRPEYLAPQDYVELMRNQRKLMGGNSSGMQNTGQSSSGALTNAGPTWSADTSVTLGAPETLFPWKITKVGRTGNIFRVEGGLYDGVAVAAQTVDIGAPRPRYIYIKANWTVTVWSGKFAASVARSGPPSFASSETPIASDTVIPAGTNELKTLIGVIASGDGISQFQRENLVFGFRDNGSFTGEAAVV